MTRTSCRDIGVSLVGLWIALSVLALPARAQTPDEDRGAMGYVPAGTALGPGAKTVDVTP